MVAVRQEPPGQPELDISNVIAAFSEDQVERITGLNKGRLRYWARTDFFRPSFVEDNLRLAYSRFYSFKDIVALRTLEVLRIQHSVPLQHLRKVAEKLVHLKDELWTKTSLFVVNRRVIFQNPETGKPQEVVSGQYLLSIKLKKIISDTRNDVTTLNQRSSDSIGKINCPQRVVDRRNTNHCWFESTVQLPATRGRSQEHESLLVQSSGSMKMATRSIR